MGQMFSNMTKAGVQQPSSGTTPGATKYYDSPSEATSAASSQLPSPDATLGGDVLNPNMQMPAAPKLVQPTASQAVLSGGLTSPGLTTKGKILSGLFMALQGAAAGDAAARTGDPRHGYAGLGAAGLAGLNVPFQNQERANMLQQQEGQNQIQQAQLQSLPLQRQLQAATLNKTLADAQKDRYIPTHTGSVFDSTTQKFVPGTEPDTKDQNQTLDNVIAAAATKAQAAGRDPGQDPTVQQLVGLKSSIKPDKPGNDFDQFYEKYLSDNGLKDTAANQLKAHQAYAPLPKPPAEPHQIAITPDNKVINLTPGMTVPEGTQTLTGGLKGDKATGKETERKDLAGNLNENLDQLEEIAKRRPELFGPISGRISEIKNFLGHDDKDLAAIKTIEHQIGMVQQSTHGMRSAHGVQSAADSVLNNMHNGTDALLGSTKAARGSVQTFIDDVDGKKSGAKAPASASAKSTPSAPAKASSFWDKVPGSAPLGGK